MNAEELRRVFLGISATRSHLIEKFSNDLEGIEAVSSALKSWLEMSLDDRATAILRVPVGFYEGYHENHLAYDSANLMNDRAIFGAIFAVNYAKAAVYENFKKTWASEK